MKRISIIVFAIAFLGACSKFEDIDVPPQNDAVIADTNSLPEVIFASVNNKENESETRTTVVDGYKIHWQPFDAISYFAGVTHNAQYVYNGNTLATSVEFAKVNGMGTTGGPVSRSRGIYPYDINNTVVYEDGIDKISVSYPSTQVYAENSFGLGANLMIATGDSNNDDELTFRNASGYLIIKLYGEGVKVKNITLKSLCNDDKIAGRALIVTDEDKIPIVTMSNEATTSVTLDCINGGEGVALSADRANPTEFWFALPPVNISNGIQIIATDINGNVYTKYTSKAVNIERNYIQPMAALEFDENVLPYSTIGYTLAGGESTPIVFSENAFDAAISEHYFDTEANKFVIKFSSALTTIKEAAFKGTGIQTIEIPESVVAIEKEAFSETPLAAITIPGGVNTIGVDVFNNCESLTSVRFLPSLENTSLRLGCSTLGEGGKGTFYQSPLNSIYLNRELIYVDEDDEPYSANSYNKAGVFATFKDNGTVSLTIGEQVRTISKFMFCSLDIESLTIPDNVMLIDECAFSGCGSLTTLVFEESATSLEIRNKNDQANCGPFYSSPLTHIYYNRNIVYTIGEGNPFTPNGDKQGIFAIDVEKSYQQRNSASTVYIGPLIETIPEYAFCELPIKEITIPSTVMTIGNDAFNGCTYLHTITIDEGTEPLTLGYNSTNTDEGLFVNAKLAKVTLNRQILCPFTGGTLDSPSKGAFVCELNGNQALTDITIGDNVTVLPPYTFAGAGASTINLNKVASIGKGAFENAKLTSITIPASVVEISDDAFKNCTSLSSMTFEASANPLTIGFQPGTDQVGPFNQSPLTSLTLNRELVASASYAAALDSDDEGFFSEISTLTNVTLGEQVKSLSPYMFSTTGIESITIPSNVRKIGHNAFAYCTNLHSISIAESNDPINISTQKGEWAPFYESPLSTINISRNVIYVNEEGSVFTPDTSNEGLFCNKRTNDVATVSVNIGAKLNAISDFMFSKLNIKQIWIPREVISIGNSAFANCAKFDGLTCNHTTPPTLGTNAFLNCGCDTSINGIRYISVIKGAKAAFVNAPGWSNYASIITEWTPSEN